ncbi:MAG: STAS domain-containing protein [Microscillaceae bacterium]|nr:STAS domain-containing protein [Microscillaceae bacterium]
MSTDFKIIAENILLIEFFGNLIKDDHAENLQQVEEYLLGGIRLCIANLSNATYINSAGISLLVRILTKFRSKNGEMILIKPSENIYKLLIITKLIAIFTIAQDQEEAIKILKNEAPV